ncbi:MAG: hypothetical protein EBT95_04620 [Verrucomicrobia bacterium]|nr:hypothetical protein [Verrucomicrobiota bacterium]
MPLVPDPLQEVRAGVPVGVGGGKRFRGRETRQSLGLPYPESVGQGEKKIRKVFQGAVGRLQPNPVLSRDCPGGGGGGVGWGAEGKAPRSGHAAPGKGDTGGG